MDLLEHYKETYHKEIDRVATLTDSLTIPIGIITVLGTILTFYLSNFDYNYNFWLTLIFLLLMTGGSIWLCLATWNLWNAYNITGVSQDFTYDYLPSLEVQNQFYQGLIVYYAAPEFDSEDRKELINADFRKYLLDEYLATATNNMNVNNKCAEFLFICKKRILVSLAWFLIGLIPFGINYELKPEHPTLIKIQKVVDLPTQQQKSKSLDMSKKASTTPQRPGKPGQPAPKPANSQGVSYPTRPESVHVKNGKVVDSTHKMVESHRGSDGVRIKR